MTIRFPPIDAISLDGRRWHLPSDLARTSVVILAFQRWQQTEVDGWIDGLERLACPHPIFEVPTIARSYRWARPFIDGGMRAGIPDRAVRARTLTTYTSVSRVLGSQGLSSDHHVIATLATPEGYVEALVQGVFSGEEAVPFLAVRG